MFKKGAEVAASVVQVFEPWESRAWEKKLDIDKIQKGREICL